MPVTLQRLAAVADHESADIQCHGVSALKQAAKGCPALVRSHLSVLVPPLMTAVKGSNIRVKMAAERALLHLLEIHTRPATLDEYIANADATAARSVRDFARRVLVRLAADSGDEE